MPLATLEFKGEQLNIQCRRVSDQNKEHTIIPIAKEC